MYSCGNLSTITTTYPSEMEEYFRSIEKPFEDTLASKRQDESNLLQRMTTIFGFCIALSVIPAVPAILDLTVPRLTGTHSLILFRTTIALDSFKLWWPLCVAGFIVIEWATVLLSHSRSRRRQKNWLPQRQVRFALCYNIVRDIRSYERNGLPVFIDDAQAKWRELFLDLRRFFNPLGGHLLDPELIVVRGRTAEASKEFGETELPAESGLHPFASLFAQVTALCQLHPWFRLTPETKAIIDGLDGIQSKLSRRLSTKKGLGQVADCLEALSGYLYSRIHSTTGAPISEWGLDRLSAFAQRVNALPALDSEAERASIRPTMLKTAQAKVVIVGRIFMHENLLVCFAAWYLLFELLVVLGLVIAFKLLPGLRMDSVIVTSLIATPLLGAAGIIAVSKARTG